MIPPIVSGKFLMLLLFVMSVDCEVSSNISTHTNRHGVIFCFKHFVDCSNFNRHYAEYAGYWTSTDFLKYAKETDGPIQFYDSVTGKLLFTAPVGRTMEEFIMESKKHGWPSFRDEETNWEYVRVLKDGECVSVTGTHLGHNLPDKSGNRYCINLVSVAGQPKE